MRSLRHRVNQGFTLIELLVVIAIIGNPRRVINDAPTHDSLRSFRGGVLYQQQRQAGRGD